MEAENKEAVSKTIDKPFLIAGAIVLVIIIVVFYINLKPSSPPEIQQSSISLSIGSSPVLGDEGAPVTIYEFSDFSCPYCQAAEGSNQQVIDSLKSRSPTWEAPIPRIKEEYVKTGKVKIVYKYYPGHGAAEAAHAVALGLKEQSNDLFWKFAEKAYASQNLNDLNKMKELAKSLGGVDTAKLDDYINSGAYQAQLNNDIAMAKANKVSGTPMFFIIGQDKDKAQTISGAQSFQSFQDTIDGLI